MKKKPRSTRKIGKASEDINYPEDQSDEIDHAIKTMVKVLIAVEENYQAKIAEEERKKIDAESKKSN